MDDENLMCIGSGKQVRWRLWDDPRSALRVELYEVLGANGAPGREVSDASSVRASHALSI